ncbi:MAG: DUF3877 family protein [Suipraeoptans sp.]
MVPNYTALEQSIIDVVLEEQIKIGYRKEKVRLYYPSKSIINILGTNDMTDTLVDRLRKFCKYTKDKLGRIDVSHKGDRFCFIISEDGVEYIHEHMGDMSFLSDFIEVIGKHPCHIENVEDVFKNHSESYCFSVSDNKEFDYVFWFEDGKPDSYLYCLKSEGEHMIYHRFTKEDYKDFQL